MADLLAERQRLDEPEESLVSKVAELALPELKIAKALFSDRGELMDKIIKPLTILSTLLLGSVALIAAGKITGGSSLFDNYAGGSGKSSGRLSEKGRNILKNTEGFRSKAYQDIYGNWTIGYGHTGGVKPGMEITKEQAEALFDKDLSRFEKYVNKVVKVPVTQNMFDAMVLYSYQTGHLGKNFLRKLNSGDYLGAADELTLKDSKFNKREAMQQEMFRHDISSNNTIKEPSVNYTNTNAAQTGGRVGNYILDKGVSISAPMQSYLKDVGGTGIVKSGIRAAKPGQNYEKSHASGNKIDVGLGGMDDEKIIKTALPFLLNDRTIHVAFEGLGSKDNNSESVAISKRVMDKIYQRYPEIKLKVQTGRLKIYHWGWTLGGRGHHATGPHLDILVDTGKYVNLPLKDKINTSTSQNGSQAVNNTKTTAPTNTSIPSNITPSQGNTNKNTTIPTGTKIKTGGANQVNLLNTRNNSKKTNF